MDDIIEKQKKNENHISVRSCYCWAADKTFSRFYSVVLHSLKEVVTIKQMEPKMLLRFWFVLFAIPHHNQIERGKYADTTRLRAEHSKGREGEPKQNATVPEVDHFATETAAGGPKAAGPLRVCVRGGLALCMFVSQPASPSNDQWELLIPRPADQSAKFLSYQNTLTPAGTIRNAIPRDRSSGEMIRDRFGYVLEFRCKHAALCSFKATRFIFIPESFSTRFNNQQRVEDGETFRRLVLTIMNDLLALVTHDWTLYISL